MKISTRGRYALQMMVDLAQHYGENCISLKDICERQHISKKYLEQIIPFLNKDRLVLSNMGHCGGYRLSRPPEEITVKDIFFSAEGSLTPIACLDTSPNQCSECNGCMMLPVYEGLYDAISEYLDGITLKDIIDGNVKNGR